jgi:hypothetical protein
MICIAKLRRVNGSPPPLVPLSRPLSEVLDGSDALQRLKRQIDESNQRFAAIAQGLPAKLLPHVRPGPVDGTTWTLLVDHAAAAAKLRQLVPHLSQLLSQRLTSPDGQSIEIRIKVQPR